MKYSAERREAVLKKMLPPNTKTIREIAKEEGITESTLYNWRTQASAEGRLLPDGAITPEDWSSRDKFNAVRETAAMNESDLAKYCRSRGLYPEQIRSWRLGCEQANNGVEANANELSQALKQEQQNSKRLARDLALKEKALAETAALLVLRKKAQAIWGESEDE